MENRSWMVNPEDLDLWSTPPPSASRATREVNLEKLWPGPYRAKASWFEEVKFSSTEVRETERMNQARRRPITSRSAKVRGAEGVTLNNGEQADLLGAGSVVTSAEEIKRSLIVIGNKSTNVPNSDPRYVDPDLLWTKAPGFPAGITITSSAADAALELERKKKREEERRLEKEAMEINDAVEDEEKEPKDPEHLAAEQLAPYPEDHKKRRSGGVGGGDEYTKNTTKPWAVVDESDVSDFYTHVPQLAIQYPFELDAFQKRAVKHLEKGESVFVAAHTSAGKTVVAEYAIALAFEHRTRLVYTSPIKALSNQKFRDFVDKFGADKVGLLTGDNSVNPDAPCVIMTTEILRSMLYRGAEMIRDVEFVVFDEVHYISDPERGVIWEEVVIMLPLHVHVVMLSATTPNTEEFSAWVGRNRREQVFVVSTDKRPVPLEHFLYVEGDTFKIMDSSNRFIKEAHAAAMNAQRAKDPFADLPGRNNSALQPKRGEVKYAQQKWEHSSGGGSKNVRTGESRWLNLVKDLDKKKLLPAIIFTFSKKKVEERASALSKIDLLTAKEKSQAHMILQKALQRLQEGDRKLPQIRRVADFLSKGVGIHHGGLLPLLKEVVEICFTSGLVRVLIATETFAMGVNAPCRTVVFGGLRKHDGNTFRDLLPGEYIQMCGRAGRRGLDTVGTVLIHCEDDVPPIENLAQMMSGRSSRLDSRFRLRYAMMLNLLRADALSVADMMKRSFSEFARSNHVGTKLQQIKAKRREVKEAKKRCFEEFKCIREAEGATVRDIEDYHLEMDAVTQGTGECIRELLSERHGRKAREELFRPGRVVVVSLADLQLYSLFAVIVQESQQQPPQQENNKTYIVVALVPESFVLPVNAPTLVVAESLSSSSSSSSAAAAAGVAAAVDSKIKSRTITGKRRFDDDDDEFTVKGAAVGKKKNAPVFFERGAAAAPPAPPKFFDRSAAPTTMITSTSAASSSMTTTADILPRATFGWFGNEDLDGKRERICVARITVDEVERVTALYLEQGVSRELAQRIALERSERDAGILALQLSRKAAMIDASSLQTYKVLDLPRDLKADAMGLVDRWNSLERRRRIAQSGSLCDSCSVKNAHRDLMRRVANEQLELKRLQTDVSDESLAHFPDFVARLDVLKALKYITADEDEDDQDKETQVELKGRVAAEINTSDELLLTEMVFENVFDPLDPAESIALLSCLVLQGKCEDEVEPPTGNLADALERTVEIASRLQQVQEDRGVRLERGAMDDWVKSVLNPGMLLVTFEWARGRPFASLTDMTSLEEGIIVRTITRLDETCREVKNIARLIGDPLLLQKMELASAAIKRDIVFATSLYVG